MKYVTAFDFVDIYTHTHTHTHTHMYMILDVYVTLSRNILPYFASYIFTSQLAFILPVTIVQYCP